MIIQPKSDALQYALASVSEDVLRRVVQIRMCPVTRGGLPDPHAVGKVLLEELSERDYDAWEADERPSTIKAEEHFAKAHGLIDALPPRQDMAALRAELAGRDEQLSALRNSHIDYVASMQRDSAAQIARLSQQMSDAQQQAGELQERFDQARQHVSDLDAALLDAHTLLHELSDAVLASPEHSGAVIELAHRARRLVEPVCGDGEPTP